MGRIKLSVELDVDEVEFLGELAERKHCTLAEIVEEAVFVFVRRRQASEAAE